MSFESILFQKASLRPTSTSPDPPEYFGDLHLGQIVDSITVRWTEYDLQPFFRTPLQDLGSVLYRQEVMRDLESPETLQTIRSFSEKMQLMRGNLNLSNKLYYESERQRWLLKAVVVYCDALSELHRDLHRLEPHSLGMASLRDYLAECVRGAPFIELQAGAKAVQSALSQICYCVLIKESVMTVRGFHGEADQSATVEETFEKFRRGAVHDYRVRFSDRTGMNHVEAQVLEGVARLYPEVFRSLREFVELHADFVDERIARFDREVQFYVSYLAYVERFRAARLPFCYPQLSDASKEVDAYDAFDAALAERLLAEGKTTVQNGFHLRGEERLLVVTGPNQGGKTTFARVFGQLHYLASLGCPVPGTEARLFLGDQLFAHFEREERVETQRGKLQDELVRIHRILERATSRSIIIVNEIFSSTTLEDAVFLSKKVLTRLSELDLLGVWVTFLSELASFDRKTVSVVGVVDPKDPGGRTYKLERRPAIGSAYALAVAERYGVTYERLMARIPS